MQRTEFWVGIIALAVLGTLVVAQERPQGAESARTAEEILRSYVEDFRTDAAAAEAMTFGVRVSGEGGGDWHVAVAGKKEGAAAADVSLRPGLPAEPCVLYTLDLETLRRIDAGELNALTAMGRAREADPTPMDIDFMPGFQPTPDFIVRFLPFTFHFWTRGFPETVPFGREHSRLVHGGNIVIFYYQEGLRSGWAQLEKGQHVNADPRDQVNEFPSMFIVIRGRAMGKIGGKEGLLTAGEMILVPAGVSHEMWNPFDEPAEVILVMFGAGA
jgi:mannose-6-phosphate isomerase-like protein (cupin superfamily)